MWHIHYSFMYLLEDRKIISCGSQDTFLDKNDTFKFQHSDMIQIVNNTLTNSLKGKPELN